MIVVTVELVSGGSEIRRCTIGTLRIANLSDLAPISDYSVDVLEAANPLAGTPARTGSCLIEGHARAQSVWALIGRAIGALESADFVEL
ncbi:hypothetical protein IVB30_20095 [Bradyrhizobium sp. 200]|uniref:hypothetical protein n=1 Tax=Bradyrhizobium sp. 200 TaxID=2782665 RepID=UPI0020003948|nr:hypothetical protein [Bradyrhizobium sp. 200]UPJ53410.1 hypothetical protein IVB30_20095 [Bradyrhizobium sp. 200]